MPSELQAQPSAIPFEIFSPNFLTGIETSRVGNDGVLRFNVEGLGTDVVRWDSSGFTWNNNNDVLPMNFKGTAEDYLLYIDPANDSVGVGTNNTTFLFQQIGGGPFTSNPRALFKVGDAANDTGFVLQAWSDTASKAGLVEFLRARANETVPQQFDTVGGFRAGVWDGAKYLGSTGLFFSLDQNAATDYAPIALDFRAGDGFSVSTVILKGSSAGNAGIRTGTPIAEITMEGNVVSNYSAVAKNFRHAGNSLANLFLVDGTNGYVQVGGASAGSVARFGQTAIDFNRLNGDIDYRIRTTSYSKFFWIDAGLNVAGFGSTFGTEWLRISANAVTINETGDALTVFRIESDLEQNLFKSDPANNRIGFSLSTPTSTNHFNKSFARSAVSKTTTYTLTEDDYRVFGDASGGDFTLTLPTAVGITGREYNIINIGATGNVTIDGDGTETISGSTTLTLTAQWQSVVITSDGSNWIRCS